MCIYRETNQSEKQAVLWTAGKIIPLQQWYLELACTVRKLTEHNLLQFTFLRIIFQPPISMPLALLWAPGNGIYNNWLNIKTSIMQNILCLFSVNKIASINATSNYQVSSLKCRIGVFEGEGESSVKLIPALLYQRAWGSHRWNRDTCTVSSAGTRESSVKPRYLCC